MKHFLQSVVYVLLILCGYDKAVSLIIHHICTSSYRSDNGNTPDRHSFKQTYGQALKM